MEKHRVIEEIKKNQQETVRVCLQTWNGRDYIDIRVWIAEKEGQNEVMVATRKGVTVKVELLPKLIAALEKARKEIDGEGGGKW